jgi:hypothetical protein
VPERVPVAVDDEQPATDGGPQCREQLIGRQTSRVFQRAVAEVRTMHGRQPQQLPRDRRETLGPREDQLGDGVGQLAVGLVGQLLQEERVSFRAVQYRAEPG